MKEHETNKPRKRVLNKEKRSLSKQDLFNETHPDLPGSDTAVRLAEHEVNSFPSGLQSADNPTLNPPYHFSPDARASKRFHPCEIQGWGADLAKEDRPGYPKERMPARPIGVHWEQPETQIPKVKILHSVERAGITPVFGTPCPPRGVSGKMREMAYLMSENDLRHWLMLMAADRVDVVEGLIEDVTHGHFPNFFKERGLKAELKHRPVRFVAKTALWAGAIGLGIFLYQKKRQARKPKYDASQGVLSDETSLLYVVI